jgi:hypothetical protein
MYQIHVWLFNIAGTYNGILLPNHPTASQYRHPLLLPATATAN